MEEGKASDPASAPDYGTEPSPLVGPYGRNGDLREASEEQENEKLTFMTLIGITEILGLTCLILVGIWMGHYRGGFAWDGSGKEFNYHPVFMVFGLVVLYGNNILFFRIFKDTDKMMVKIAHAVCQFVSFILTVLGLVTVFDFHNHNNIPNMYSLHSWVGMVVVVLFSCQFLAGFFSFLWPKFRDSLRAVYLKVHVFFGLAIFVSAVAACLLGMTEKLFFSIPSDYSKFVPEGLMTNVLGLLLMVFAGLVAFLATNPQYKRPPEATDNAYAPIS